MSSAGIELNDVRANSLKPLTNSLSYSLQELNLADQQDLLLNIPLNEY